MRTGPTVTVGGDGTISIPVTDARTNGMACALVGPKERRNAIRWFVRMPTEEEATRFPCPMGYDRKTIRFEPFLLYLDCPIPARTQVQFHKVVCGGEVGKIDKTPLDRWSPTPQETVFWPALHFSVGPLAPDQVVELLGTSWWRRTPGKRRVDPWETLERGPQFEEQRILSLYCLLRMSWLPAQMSRTRFQFVPGRASSRAPTPHVDPKIPRPPTPPETTEGPPPITSVDQEPSSDG